MAEFANPPLLKSQPANGQVAVYEAASDSWVPTGVADVGALVVPQTHIANFAAPSAETAAAVATANAAAQGVGYVQADVQTIATLANALKTNQNLLVTDVGTLVTELGAAVTKLNTLIAELQTAGVLAAS